MINRKKNFFKIIENNSNPTVRIVRIVLLALIIIGIGLIFTRNIWAPNLVSYLLSK